MLLGVLLASLCGLANLLSDNLPLVVLVLLDSTHQRRALILGKLCVMHVLVPVFLDTAFCPQWKGLGYLSPAGAPIPHLFQAQLFRWRPRCIRPALLGGGRLRGGLGIVDRGGRLGRSRYRCGGCGHGNWGRDLGGLLDGGWSSLGRGRHRGGRGLRGRCRSGALAPVSGRGRGRSRGGLGCRLLRRLLMDLLGLNRGRLRRVLDMLGLDVLGLDVLLLLDVLLSGRALLGLLSEMLLLLLLLLLRGMLLNMLGMLDVLRHMLLLLLLRGNGRLDRARVVLLLLLLVLSLGLGLGLGLGLSVRLGAICSIVDGIIATVHIGLTILVWLCLAVTPRRISKRRMLLGHGHGLLGLGRP